ncbi:hypothetical protein SNEBB_009672 [Seison nebaliae]|nr:hypothetical protein SNEBB_009672 [Seison nebaliae]
MSFCVDGRIFSKATMFLKKMGNASNVKLNDAKSKIMLWNNQKFNELNDEEDNYTLIPRDFKQIDPQDIARLYATQIYYRMSRNGKMPDLKEILCNEIVNIYGEEKSKVIASSIITHLMKLTNVSSEEILKTENDDTLSFSPSFTEFTCKTNMTALNSFMELKEELMEIDHEIKKKLIGKKDEEDEKSENEASETTVYFPVDDAKIINQLSDAVECKEVTNAQLKKFIK